MRKIWAFCIILVIFGSLFGQEGAEYLIITHNNFAQTINSLTEWKYMKGVQTKVVKLSEIGEDPSNEDIRNFIITAYNTWDPQPEYVLLVGDIGFLPVGQSSPCRSDNYYANMEGDFKAELSVGRFPCQTACECSTMANKIMAYERTPWLEDTMWFKKSTIVIRFDDLGDTLGYYVQDLRYIRDTCMIPAGFNVDSLFNRAGQGWHNQGPDSARHVINVLNNGRGFLVYRGESAHDWYSPFNGIPDSVRLSNGSKLPIIFAGACTSVLTGSSVGEKWLSAGTPDMLKGAVAYIGNSQAGSSSWRHHVNRAFFKAICLEDSLILGHAFLRAKDSLYANYPNYEAYYVECNLLGDPTLQLWTEVPKSMTVQHPDVIEMNVPIDLVITVYDTESQLPIQGALVTLYKPNGSGPEIYESTITDDEGMVVFENLTVPTSGIMYATITFQNCVPYQGEIQVYQMMTDDPLALAYNGNRHLVRKPNSEELYLVYTNEDEIIYRYSSNGGNDWSSPLIIGDGKFPAITLSSDYLPSVSWTDDDGGLWYRRQTGAGQWSDIYHLWNPVGVDPLRLNSPPSIAIHASNPNTVHILVTRTGGPPRDVNHRVEDYTFTITIPMQGTFVLIEQAHGPHDPPLRTFPSIARCEVNNSLHAVWQRSDTICYATKPRNDPWVNWGPEFELDGLQSAHPFVETYGDSIFVVWQRKEGFYNYEEVYRAARHLSYTFGWRNFSLTPATKSLYPVNASGFFTVFVDLPSPYMNTWWEIYYKTRPQEPLYNISRAPYTWSHYPHSAARFCAISGSNLYTAWLEKPGAAYAIRFKRIHHMPRDMAYLTSSNGHNPSSPYLIARDSCISEWQIPVDIGYETITYQFPLEPGYEYKLKAVAYHERADKWKVKISIDGEEVGEIEYETYEPETLELWIPAAFYADGVINVIFECDDGDFAAVGPIFIYQYEYEEGEGGFPGGPMTQENQPINKFSFMITPNPFIQNLNIKFQNQTEKGISVKVYDVSGRLVKNLYKGVIKGTSILKWDSKDETGGSVAQGVYFLQVENFTSGDTFCRKIIKVR